MRAVVGIDEFEELAHDVVARLGGVVALGDEGLEVCHQFAEQAGEVVSSGQRTVGVGCFLHEGEQEFLVEVYLVRVCGLDGVDGVLGEEVHRAPSLSVKG